MFATHQANLSAILDTFTGRKIDLSKFRKLKVQNKECNLG